MPDGAERSERAARGVRRRPASARAGRARDRRALLLAAAGLALAGAVLAGSVSGGPHGGGGSKAPGHAIAEAAEDEVAPAAEPEPCADGREPAESYRAGREVGSAVERIQDREQLIVGIDQNSYLWGYRSPENGEIVGFDLDLVHAIADDLLGENAPNPVRYLAIPTNQREAAVMAGDVDMVVRAVSITCDRWQDVAFSTAYFETGQQLLVPHNSPIDGYDASLAGMTVCSADDSTAQDWLRHESHGAELVFAPNHLDCLVQVQLGLADALMTDSALAAGHIAQDPSMRLVGEPLTVESYGVAMNHDDVDLVRWVNAVLEDYVEGGSQSRWAQSADRWLRGHLYDEDEPPPAPPQPQYRD